MAKPKVIGVIIARGGSQGLPGKHTRELLGKPVVQYSVEAALRSESLEEIIVTSDDPKVLEIARPHGVWVVGRPKDLANSTATVDSAARFAVDRAEEYYGFDADVIVLLYGNIPIRPDGLIDMAVNHLLEHGGSSVQSYSPVGKMHPDWMVHLQDGDHVELNCEKPIYRRQELRPMFMPNGGVLAMTRESMYSQPAHEEDFHAFLGKDRRGIVHPESHLIVDIDEERDLFIAEAILRSMQEKVYASNAKSSSLA